MDCRLRVAVIHNLILNTNNDTFQHIYTTSFNTYLQFLNYFSLSATVIQKIDLLV